MQICEGEALTSTSLKHCCLPYNLASTASSLQRSILSFDGQCGTLKN